MWGLFVLIKYINFKNNLKLKLKMEAKLKKAPNGFQVNKASDMTAKTYVLVGNFFSLIGKSHFPPTYTIPSEDMVYMTWVDKDGNVQEGQRHIKYVPSFPSIFVDEQPTGEAALKLKRGEIVFKDGHLVVSPMEKNLNDFLKLCNWNKSNEEIRMPGKATIFKLLDLEFEAKKQNDIEKEKFRVDKMIYEMSGMELKGLAQTLYIRDWNVKSSEELQLELCNIARRNPAAFLEELNSEARKMKYYVMQALDKRLISYDAIQNRLYWTRDGIDISVAPVGKDALDFFIEGALTSDRIRNLYEKIKEVVSEKVVEDKKEKSKEVKNLSVDEMLDICSRKNVIEVNPSWIKIPGFKNFGPGQTQAIDMINKDEAAIEFLRKNSI